MSAFVADLGELARTVEHLTAFGVAVDERVAELDAAAARMDWFGAAAEEHAAAHERWVRGAREMHAGVDGMRRRLATAHGNYHAAVTANLTMWP